jgi:hypothetical protein
MVAGVTDVLTKACLPGGPGMLEWGRVDRDTMILRLREFAMAEVNRWQLILDASDDEIKVSIVRGVHRQKELKVL